MSEPISTLQTSDLNLLPQDDLLSAALKSDKLPSLPSVAIEIVRLCKSDDVPLDDLTQVVSIDPSLAAKILQLANSARYRQNREVTDLNRACFVIGLKTLKIMALGFTVSAAVDKTGGSSQFSLKAFWAHSVSCAVVAREFAKLIRSPYENEAFFCGLLARIGQLAMARAIPAEYDSVVSSSESDLPSAREETEVLGFDHHVLADRLMNKWQLPQLLVQAIGNWGCPENAGESSEICRIVRIADLIARLLQDENKGDPLRLTYEYAATDFGLEETEIDSFVVLQNDEIESLARILDVKIDDQAEYQQLLDDARDQMVQLSLQNAMELESTSVDLEQERKKTSRLEDESAKLLKRSQMDPLTGIPNRGEFDNRYWAWMNAQVKESSPKNIAILMIDVDHFKSFNDTHGHLVGDKVLVAVAEALKQALRPADFVARYGGEEFVVMLPGVDVNSLQVIGERTRRVIENAVLQHEGKQLQVTASMGGAIGSEFVEIGEGMKLIRLADECLYQAKKNGRNCFYFAKYKNPAATN